MLPLEQVPPRIEGPLCGGQVRCIEFSYGSVAAVGLPECEARQLPVRNEPVENGCAAVGLSRRLGAPGDPAPRVAVAVLDTSASSSET
jgi:hypothetical protein